MLRVHRPHAAANGVPRFSGTPQRLTLGFAVPAALISFPSPSFQSHHPTSPQQQNRFETGFFFAAVVQGLVIQEKYHFLSIRCNSFAKSLQHNLDGIQLVGEQGFILPF